MALFFITGISGSGKSEVRKELIRRHITCYGTDEDDIARFVDTDTGNEVVNPDMEARTPKWRTHHVWNIRETSIEKLQQEAKDKPIFLTGAAANDREFTAAFKQVFALVLDDDTLRHRIITRTTNNYGKLPHELESIMEWNKTAKEDYAAHGAVVIDSLRPVKEIADQILKLAI